MCNVTRDLQTLPFGKLPHFLRILPPCSVKYFMHVRKTFIKRHLAIQKCSQPNLFRACGAAIAQSKSFAYVGPSDWNKPNRHVVCAGALGRVKIDT